MWAGNVLPHVGEALNKRQRQKVMELADKGMVWGYLLIRLVLTPSIPVNGFLQGVTKEHFNRRIVRAAFGNTPNAEKIWEAFTALKTSNLNIVPYFEPMTEGNPTTDICKIYLDRLPSRNHFALYAWFLDASRSELLFTMGSELLNRWQRYLTKPYLFYWSSVPWSNFFLVPSLHSVRL